MGKISKKCHGSWREGEDLVLSCGELKPATNSFFNKNKQNRDGLQNMCRECDNKASRASYQNNLIENRRKRAEWQEENMDLHKQHCREYQSKPEVKAKNRKRRVDAKKQRDEFNIDAKTAFERLQEYKSKPERKRKGAYKRK